MYFNILIQKGILIILKTCVCDIVGIVVEFVSNENSIEVKVPWWGLNIIDSWCHRDFVYNTFWFKITKTCIFKSLVNNNKSGHWLLECANFAKNDSWVRALNIQ